MTEDELIKRYFLSSNLSDGVSVGIGDDAAVLSVPEGFQLVTSVDTLLEGVHFPDGFKPEYLASRAVAVCVSDLAAMGAKPKWLTLALSLPEINTKWLEAFSRSLHVHCAKYGMQLVGGDTVKGKLAVTLNVLGIVENQTALCRNGAISGDRVYVSGSLGGAACALSAIQEKTQIESELLACFTQPQARIALGQALTGIASSCMDISDGVLLDVQRLMQASQLGVKIDLDKLPLNSAIQKIAFEDALRFATSGDDYELLFTVNPSELDKISNIAKELNIELTEIGTVTKHPGLECFYQGKPYAVDTIGYQHFS